MANEDQPKDIAGKAKEKIGDTTGYDEMKREGQADRAEGRIQKGYGDAENKLSDD